MIILLISITYIGVDCISVDGWKSNRFALTFKPAYKILEPVT